MLVESTFQKPNRAGRNKVAQSPLVEQIVLNTLYLQVVSWISVTTSDRLEVENICALNREGLARQGKPKENARNMISR